MLWVFPVSLLTCFFTLLFDSLFLLSYNLCLRICIGNSPCILFDFLSWQWVSCQRAFVLCVGGLVSNVLYYTSFRFFFSRRFCLCFVFHPYNLPYTFALARHLYSFCHCFFHGDAPPGARNSFLGFTSFSSLDVAPSDPVRVVQGCSLTCTWVCRQRSLCHRNLCTSIQAFCCTTQHHISQISDILFLFNLEHWHKHNE